MNKDQFFCNLESEQRETLELTLKWLEQDSLTPREQRVFEEAIRLDPNTQIEPQILAEQLFRNSVQSHLFEGRQLAQVGDLEGALEELRKAIALDDTIVLDITAIEQAWHGAVAVGEDPVLGFEETVLSVLREW